MLQTPLHKKNNEIDRKKWDAAIIKSSNPSVYALSWYLDIVSPEWEAIISEDYNTVFPVTQRKYVGKKFIVHPLYAQQLGLFSDKNLTEAGISEFFKAIPYPILSIQLNAKHPPTGKLTTESIPNILLALNQPYEALRKNYSSNCKRNIAKASKQQQNLSSTVDSDKFIAFAKENCPYPQPEKVWELFRNITEKTLLNNAGEIIVVSQDQTTLAMGIFLKNQQQITFLSGYSSPLGKEYRSMFLLMDYIIRENAASDRVLDFEGSSVESIARFYRGYGGINTPFYNYINPAFKIGLWLKEKSQLLKN